MDRLRANGKRCQEQYIQQFDDRIDRDNRWKEETEEFKQWARAMLDRLRKLKPRSALVEELEGLVEDLQWIDKDPGPAMPWRQALDMAVHLLEQQNNPVIAQDLCTIYSKIRDIGIRHTSTTQASFVKRTTASRQEGIQDVARRFEVAVSNADLKSPLVYPAELDMLKASCAYTLKGVVGVLPQPPAQR